MASTKGLTAIWSSQTLTASAGDTTSSAVVLDDGYGAAVSIKLTNGATGPTIAAQVQIQVSQDNSEWYDFGGPLVGDTANSAVVSWGGIEVPIGVEYLRLVAGSNTGQNVTVDADISEVTAL
jgi:hypothetical protein